jgi:two-component system, OmpR family, sensor histidine kinase VicK
MCLIAFGAGQYQRKKELERLKIKTRIIEDGHQIVKEISRLIASSNELHTCLTAGGMQYSYNHFFELEKKLLEKQKKGEHRGIKYISNIEKDNAELAKIFLDGGIQIRHVKNLPPISFGVSDKEIAATIEKMEGGRMVQSLLLSNESAYVNHFKSIFEELWKDGIVAAERIKDLETGMQSDIEVIPNSARAREVYLNLVKKAKEEIMIIFPTTGAFVRQSKLGVIELAKEAARLRNTKVRILMPASKLTDQVIIDLKRDYPYNFHIRYHVEQTSAAKATIMVVDRKDSLVMELRDDSTTTFEEAIGFSTHSNSRPGVLSYVAIFENIWMHTEMFEELKVHERMQQEFINVAAHELRTPIQPIISAASLLSSKKSEISREEIDRSTDIISRNAQRLKQLSDDILDVTKIESHTLQLKKELVDLDEMISNIVQDYRNQIARDIRPIKLLYEGARSKASINIEADRMRLNQVFHNLLSNAIKFTNKEGGGTIYISLRGEEEERDGTGVVIGKNNVYVRIRDTGTGIHPEIFTRLFKKFASKSYQGTGLGLYISKNIIEAHGGKIWGENNADGKGTTFTFSLPISEQTTW